MKPYRREYFQEHVSQLVALPNGGQSGDEPLLVCFVDEQ